MKRVILLISVLATFLGGCNYPNASIASSLESPTLQTKVHTPTSTVVKITPPEPSPTTAPTPEKIEPTQPPQPTATLSARQMPRLTPNSEVILTQISMTNQKEGWGIGHQLGSNDHILYTKDGGQTWADRTPPEPPPQQEESQKIAWGYFADKNNAWVIYAYQKWHVVPQPSLVWKTTDGGITWQPSQPLSLTGQEEFFLPEGFTFPDTEHGWLLIHVGGGMHHDYSLLYRTTDGGQSWERMIDPYKTGLQSLENTDLAFVDENVGWVGKNNMGVMLGAFWEHTEDGGRNWESSFLPAPPELDWKNDPNACRTESPHFTSSQTAVFLVNCRVFEDDKEKTLTYIYTTGNRGENWQHAQLPSQVDELDFIDYQTGWATGRDIYQTTDGGLSWVKIKTVHWSGQFSFVDAQHGWAVASDEDATVLVKTEDGGRSWKLLTPMVKEE